jgi:uncharacterized protein
MATPSFRLRSSLHERFAPRLVIMIKEPVAGRVKTRLARGIGTVAATAAYRAMLSTLAARLGSDRRWQTVFAVSPDTAVSSSLLPLTAMRVAQGPGDLGDRLQRIFDITPPGPVVVIGTDIPAITPEDIASAFDALGSHDAVFGPSHDGGYWLIGLKRQPRIARPFANVRWSTEHARADTITNLAGLSVAHLKFLDDIDTADDLSRQRHVVGRRILPTAKLKD